MQSFEQASAFIAAIGADNQLVNFRAIHDTDKAIHAVNMRGTLIDCWSRICDFNNSGYGIFANIAVMDGNGLYLENVQSIRAHYVDLDNLSAQQNLERAAAAYPAPSFAVNSSPGKYHVYWPVVPYKDNARFEIVQRKLRQVFDGDKTVIDATRVLRLPGTFHLKRPDAPHLVNCFALPGYGYVSSVETLEAALQSVNVLDGGVGTRHELGEPSQAAPAAGWLQTALNLTDPNSLDRDGWIKFTAAFKQAGWSLIDQDALFNMWSEWCAKYAMNDVGENHKQWHSIRNTEIGWKWLLRHVPQLQAYFSFEGKPRTEPPAPSPVPPIQPQPGEVFPDMLTAQEQQRYFSDCVLVERLGEIVVPSGCAMNATKFNAKYGGKKFIIDSEGKITNEPWQAATRSTLWTVPKVDHMRFMPSKPYGERIRDDLGRDGFNMYRPAIVERQQGDVTPFLRHLQAMLPVENDRRILLDYMAHNIRFPGYKIPWAPVIQSVEGIGKGVIKHVLEHSLGRSYVYFPNAKEMVESGSKFNAWMRNKLFILADEIKVDERRDMIEVLKPMISEERIEIQGKGENQDKEDNYANWAFFTNYKDAVPVDKNARRFSIFYSHLQSVEDLLRHGMNDAYFQALYDWLKFGGGAAIVADWFMRYDIARGSIPMRAPDTSSTIEALNVSRSPIEQAILDAVQDGVPGFRGGFISVIAAVKLAKATTGRNMSPKTIMAILEHIRYVPIGRAPRTYMQEDINARSVLYGMTATLDVNTYGALQGYAS